MPEAPKLHLPAGLPAGGKVAYMTTLVLRLGPSHGWSAPELARATGIPRRTVYRILQAARLAGWELRPPTAPR